MHLIAELLPRGLACDAAQSDDGVAHLLPEAAAQLRRALE
jgi:hypothetical protein